MKKLFVLLSLVTGLAHATEITILNEGNPQSPTTVFGLALKNAIKGDVKWEQATSCRDAQNKFRKIKNAVLIYNTSNDFADRTTNNPCEFDKFTAKNTIIITAMPMKICRAVDNKKSINDGKVTLGLASMVATQRHEADWNSNGLNIRFVPYGGSAGVVTATVNKEVDYGWIGSPMASKQERDGKLECLYSTDSKSAKFLGKKLKLSVPDFEIITLAYTNSADPEVIARLREAARNPEFVSWMAASDTTANSNPTEQDLARVNNFVTKLINSWAN
jgi:hypothetical protein